MKQANTSIPTWGTGPKRNRLQIVKNDVRPTTTVRTFLTGLTVAATSKDSMLGRTMLLAGMGR